MEGQSRQMDTASKHTSKFCSETRKTKNICSKKRVAWQCRGWHQGFVQWQWNLFFHVCQSRGKRKFQGRYRYCSPDHWQSVSERFPDYVHMHWNWFIKRNPKKHNPNSKKWVTTALSPVYHCNSVFNVFSPCQRYPLALSFYWWACCCPVCLWLCCSSTSPLTSFFYSVPVCHWQNTKMVRKNFSSIYGFRK